MNVIVHLMFAITVRRKIRKNLGVSINLRGFLYGNILPDISKKYGSCPHYMKDALPHILASKDRILYKNNNCSVSNYRYAKNLGTINHYLSDFFCLPHTDGYTGSKVQHGIYEFLMIARYKKGLKGYRALLKNQDIFLEPDDFKSFIEDENNEYIEKRASGANDIRYALFAATKLSESIVTYSKAFSLSEDLVAAF